MSSHTRLKSIGDQELALLQFIGERAPVTVAGAVEGFGHPRGLARSTVLTMVDRLRRKGRPEPPLIGGVFHYEPKTHHTAAVRNAIALFVDRTLGGSISPFVASLGEREQVSDAELAQLERVLETLQRERRKKR